MRQIRTLALRPLLMAFVIFLGSILPMIPAKAAGKTLIIHYGGRTDQNYEGWNLWIWEDSNDGKQVDFSRDDAYGKIAIYQTDQDPYKIGLIVRYKDWESKDIGRDRFVTMDRNYVEIWLTSNESDILYEAPDQAKNFDFDASEKERLSTYEELNAYKVNVHYYNFSNRYDRSLQLYAGEQNHTMASYPFVGKDGFGAVFHAGFLPDDEEETIQLRIDDPRSTSPTLNHTVKLKKAKNKVLDIYLVEGNSSFWYKEEKAVKDPVIVSADFRASTSKKIRISLSKELGRYSLDSFHLVDEDNTEYAIAAVEPQGCEVDVVMEEELPLFRNYTIQIDGYVSCEVSKQNIVCSSYFDEMYAYDGDDLGVSYTAEQSIFKVWAPLASKVSLNLYRTGDGESLVESVPMITQDRGVWTITKPGDYNGFYYTYTITNGLETVETVDPYAKSAGVNGNRGMVLDLESTNPKGFETDVRPELKNAVDSVIYEMHIRDFSSDESSGITQKGKYLGVTETGTTNGIGYATGLDYLVDLGVTHVELQPVFDYATVDENKEESDYYSWGYDPKNYNVPEGSYSTDPYHGEVRVNELKQMVQTLHSNGIRVNMDVVYHHTYNVKNACFEKVVPDYFYRISKEGYSDGAGAGNEIATERAMARKYIVDSVVYWAREYHIDGFHFDLMALYDLETMEAVREALNQVDPSIMVYGEGWTSGSTILSKSQQSSKTNVAKLTGISSFSDDIRDGIRGDVFDASSKGFINGGIGMEESVKYGVVGAISHSEISMAKNYKGTEIWALAPEQCINYASSHSNLTLWDKLVMSNVEDSSEERIRMNQLSAAIVMTSQGIPFMLSGEEMLRSKPSSTKEGAFDENSYASPDSTNSLKWSTLGGVYPTCEYYKQLIAFRKMHPAFRMTESSDIQKKLHFMSDLEENVVAYTISDHANEDTAEKIMVIYNANKKAVSIPLPEGSWDICLNGEQAGKIRLGTAESSVTVEGISAMVLVQGDDTIISPKEAATKSQSIDQPENLISHNFIVILGVIVVGLILVIVLLFLTFQKR